MFTRLLISALVFSWCASPVCARDMMGLIDGNGNEIIPCKYKFLRTVGAGFYLATGFKSGPGAPQNDKGIKISSPLPEEMKSRFMENGPLTPKILFDNDGKEILLPLPKNTFLADVYISEASKYQRPQNAAPKSLPEDTLLQIVGENGSGVCDVKGNILIEPKYDVLNLGGCESGKIYISTWDATTKRLRQEAIPISVKFAARESGLKLVDKVLADQKPSDGLLVFRDSNKYGYKDEKANIVIPAQYYNALPFSEGMAAVRLNPWQGPEVGKHCFIDKTGKIISPIYWRATGFHGRLACVTMKGELGSKVIPDAMLPPPFLLKSNPNAYMTRMESLKRSYVRNPVALIDRNFDYVLPLAERNIEYLKEGYWVVVHGGDPAIVLDLDGREVFRTPEPANFVRKEGPPFTFTTSGSGRKKIYYYDKAGKLQNTVLGELDRTGLNPAVVHLSGSEYGSVDGLVDRDGKFTLNPIQAKLQAIGMQRTIKTEYGTSFVREDWIRPDTARGKEFELFLRNYKLIGMTKADVEKFLGPGSAITPNLLSYTLSGFGSSCGNAYVSVLMEFEENKVKRWRYRRDGERRDWNE